MAKPGAINEKEQCKERLTLVAEIRELEYSQTQVRAYIYKNKLEHVLTELKHGPMGLAW